jgi:hypothetical protein
MRLLPWWVLEKPHCGLRHRFFMGTNFEAASMRRLRSSFFSSSGNLELTRPRNDALALGRVAQRLEAAGALGVVFEGIIARE